MILNQLLKMTSPWKAKIIINVANNAIIVTGFNGAKNLLLNHSSPLELSRIFLLKYPATSGITIYRSTDIISTSLGTTILDIPNSSITIGAKRTNMIKSFTATCTNV
ncbi:hypothetical protein SDC9_182074 [bioreactor metagenome]|uniref:Uncharacterized protein n=1 Tax=bioreactor metagenome TaxID=1076179 RepID=A0A645H7C4_9ZZZZ